MTRALLAFATLFFLPAFAWAKDSPALCDFYSAKARELACPADNYLLSFGHYYCRNFLEGEERFSAEGQVVFRRIRHCLIDLLKNTPNLNCQNAKKVAEESHVTCYVASGYCNLGYHDSWVVLSSAWRELLDPSFWGVGARIRARCREQSGP